jgi:mRNA interferase RelE/StbE
MRVEITRQFSKDVLDAELDIQEAVIELIETAREIDSIRKLSNIKKLKGYKNAYRVRLGKYRVGLLTIENDTISFERCLRRDKIYNVFP